MSCKLVLHYNECNIKKGIEKSVCLSLKWVFDHHVWWVWFGFMERIDRLKWSVIDGPMWRQPECDGKESEMPVVSEEFSLKEAKQIHYIPIGNMVSLNK